MELQDDLVESAAQRRKDLTATEGHIIALEYVEETPLMLNRPGTSSALQAFS